MRWIANESASPGDSTTQAILKDPAAPYFPSINAKPHRMKHFAAKHAQQRGAVTVGAPGLNSAPADQQINTMHLGVAMVRFTSFENLPAPGLNYKAASQAVGPPRA